MSRASTTLTSLAGAIARAIDSYELEKSSSQQLFQQAGLDPDALKNPNSRYPDGHLSKLVRLARKATADPAFGLRAAQYVEPTSLHALGFSLLASQSLLAALQRLVRYYRIVSDAVIIDLEKGKHDYRLSVDFSDSNEVPVELFDTAMATLVNICRWLCGSDYAPLKVYMSRPQPADNEVYQDFFRAPLQFDYEANVLLFDKSSLNSELPTRNAELAYQNDKIVSDYLARLDSTRLSERVRSIFIERLVTGKFSEEQIAEQFNISLRSLQRRLREEQTSYQQLLDETRLDLALQYINRTSLTVSQCGRCAIGKEAGALTRFDIGKLFGTKFSFDKFTVNQIKRCFLATLI